MMGKVYIPSTPYARLVAKERGMDLAQAVPTGLWGAVRARDVLRLVEQGAAAARLTPLARRMAAEYGLDTAALTGSGYAGKITKLDVLAAKDRPQDSVVQAEAAAQGVRREKLRGMRKVVAQRMLRSHTEIPPVTQTMKADVTALMEARERLNKAAQDGRKYSVNDFVLAAVAKALARHRNMLVSLEGDEIVHKESVNLGMAVSVENGLLVPVIVDADRLTLAELSDIARELATRARNGKLSPDEYKGGAFSVTNLGMFGIESFTPIINQPEAAILGVCAVQEELALRNGAVCVRKVMRTSLTFDHRLLDGAGAARFQQEVTRLLENPIEIVL